MAGASGFLGTRLADRLRGQGHDITRLVRHPATEPGLVRTMNAMWILAIGGHVAVPILVKLKKPTSTSTSTPNEKPPAPPPT